MPRTADEIFTCLDANASEPLRPEAAAAMIEATRLDGNPASPHRAGREARALLEAARQRIATLFGADFEDLVFTSGGTEANSLALHATGRPVLAGATEHDCILAALPHDARHIPVESSGRIRLEALEQLLHDAPSPALVCLMLANNETGVIHPIDEIAALCRRHRAWLHVDAVQAAGRILLTLGQADSMALSAHKLGGPKGAGALLLGGARRGRLAGMLHPMFPGGGQERGRRGGTQALPAIAGFAAAAEAACADRVFRAERHARLRDRIEQAALSRGAFTCGADVPRLPNTTCLALPGRSSQAQLIALDLAGFGVSAGSACSSGRVSRSHVLEAMGLGAVAGEAIRVSLPWNVEEHAIDGFIAAYGNLR